MTDDNETISSLKLESELGGSAGGGCISCPILRKRLQTCREWVKFYHVKLEQQDKLLRIAADYDRVKQQNVELQLAYDQRTREASYMREQMANLLLEIQPLRKKISTLENDLEDEKKLTEAAENQVLSLRHTQDQQKHQIDALKAKVDLNLIEVLERKLNTARSEIKRLRCSLDDKSCEVSELKEFLQDRRDHFLRNQKKTAWSLRLAWKYGSHLTGLGVHPDELMEEPSWTRLMSLLELIESQLHSHYQVYRRKQEKSLKKDLVAIACLPSLEKWLTDFDDDQASDYDSFKTKKIKKEQQLVDEAKKLEELLQIEGKPTEEAGQQGWNAEQIQADGDSSSESDESCVEITPLVKEESDINACEIIRQKKPVKITAKEHNTGKDKSDNHKRKGRNKNDGKGKSYCKEAEVSHIKQHRGTESSDAGKLEKSDSQVNEAKPNEYFQPPACVDRSVNSPSEDIQILGDKNLNDVHNLTKPAKTEVRIDSQNDLMDIDNFSFHVEGMSEGDDPIMAILKDMKPRAKIDCLDNSFSTGELDMLPLEIQHENPIDDTLQNPQCLTGIHEDLELLSDSSDDAFDSRPKKLLTQESQGFLIDSCEQSKSSLMSQDAFAENSSDDIVDIKRVKKLLSRNVLSSQGFSFDMDEVSANSEGKNDKENIGTGNFLEIEKVGSETEKHTQRDTWDLSLSEDDGQCMSRCTELNGQVIGNSNTDTVSEVANEEEFVTKKDNTFVGDWKESHKEFEGEELVKEDRNSKHDKDGIHTNNSKATIDCGQRKLSVQETLIRRTCSRDLSSNSLGANALDIELQEDKLVQELMEPSKKIIEHSLSNDQQSQQSSQEKSSVSADCCVSEGENNITVKSSNGSFSSHPQQVFDQNLNQESTMASLHEEGIFSNSIQPKDMKDMECSSTKLRTSLESNSSDHSWLLSSESEDNEDLMHKKHVQPKTLYRKSSTSILAVEVEKATKNNAENEGFNVGIKTEDEIIITKKPGGHIKEERNLGTPKEMVDIRDTTQRSVPSKPEMAGVRFSWGKSMLQCQKMPAHRNNVDFILQEKITYEIPNAFDKLKANVFSLEIRNSRKRKVRPSIDEIQNTRLGICNKSNIDIRSKAHKNSENTDVNGSKQGKNLLEKRTKLPHKRTTKQGSQEVLSSLGNGTAVSTQEKSQRTKEPKRSVLKRMKASQSLFSSQSSGGEEASAQSVRKRRIMRKKRNQTNKSNSDREEVEISNEVSQKSSRYVSRFGRKSGDQGKKSTKSDSTASSVGSRTSPGFVKRLKRDSSSSSYGSIRTSVSESDITSPGQLSVSCKDSGEGTQCHQNSTANKEELQTVKNDTSDSETLEEEEGHFKRKHRICTVVSSDSEYSDRECKEGEQRKRKRAVEIEKSYKNELYLNTLGQVKKSSANENIRKVTQPVQNSEKAKSDVLEHLKNISSQRQGVGKAETNSKDTGMRKPFLSVKKKNFPATFEQAAQIASTLSRHHSEIQEKKRTAILLETTPQLGSKRSKKDHILPKVSSEEDIQNKTQPEKIVKKKQTVLYKSQNFCTSCSDENSENDTKDISLVEKTKSKESQSLTQPSLSDSTMKTTITPHPGLVSSLAKLGTLDRPKALPKAKTVPTTNVPASSDFIEKLFSTQRFQTNNSILQCQPKDSDGTPGREESHVECMPTADNQCAVQVPIMQSPCTSAQQQRTKNLVTCDRQTKEELMTFGKASIDNVLDSKEPIILTKENSTLPSPLTDGVKHKETHPQICQENEKKEEDPKYGFTKGTSEPRHESYVRLLPSTEKSPLHEEKENELRSVVEELATCNINGKEWRRLINKLKRLAVSTPALQIIRVFLWGILQQDPLQEKKVAQGLTPALYQLFQALCVLEIRLDQSFRTAISNSIRVLICQPSPHLRPHSLGSLAAWYVANLSVSKREDKEILQLGRAFLVDLLFHHPGTVHLALLSALNSGQKFLIRMVNHREASGIEKVLQWVAFHGIWMGTESVRTQLTKYLTNQIGVHNPPSSDLAVLVKDLLSKLLESTEIAVSCNLLTSIMILARWQGQPWIQSHLLPAVTALISKESEGGKEGQVEKVPRQLLDIVTVSLGKLNEIFSEDATSADNTILGCELQELKYALTRLLLLAWGDAMMKPR